jgi:hypothetical protein
MPAGSISIFLIQFICTFKEATLFAESVDAAGAKDFPSTSSGSSIDVIVRFARTAWEGTAPRLVVKWLVRTLCEELARALGDTRVRAFATSRERGSHNAVESSRFVAAVTPCAGSTGRASGGTIIS